MSTKITQQCNGVLPLMLQHTVGSIRAHNDDMLGLVSEAGAHKSTADVNVRAWALSGERCGV